MRAPQPTGGDFSETETDREIELVLWSMQRFVKGTPEYERIRKVWHAPGMQKAMREGFPPGTEHMETAWNELVTECRRRAQ